MRQRRTPWSTSGASGPASGTAWMPRWPRPCTTTPSATPSMSSSRSARSGGRTIVGVMGGHAAQRGTPDFAEPPSLGRLLARSGRMVATGGGPGRHGGGEPGRLPQRSCRRRISTAVLDRAGSRPGVPALGVRVGADGGGRRRTLSGRNGVAGHSHLVLRPRAAQLLRHPHRQVLRQRRPRGRSCWSSATAGSSSCPAPPGPCRRSSRTRARTTTVPRNHDAHGAGGPGPLGAPVSGVAHAAEPRRGQGDGGADLPGGQRGGGARRSGRLSRLRCGYRPPWTA